MKPCSICGDPLVMVTARDSPLTVGVCLRCDRRHCTACEKSSGGKPVYVQDPTVRRCPAGHII